MSDKNDKSATAEKPAASKTPSHVAYQIRDTEDGKGFWTRIGAAWPHADGKGFNLSLDSIPLDGRITLRIPSDKKD
jgi:hypothetical protein